MKRREFLTIAGAIATQALVASTLASRDRVRSAKENIAADHMLRIQECEVELAPGVRVHNVGYNGQVTGPLLRLKEGVPVSIDVWNKTSTPELVHWHGLHVDSRNDGAMEEGASMIPAHGKVKYRFTPSPSGTRWYHTHTMAALDLSRAAYTG